MSIHKRKDTKGVRYQVRWTDPNGKRKSKDFTTKQVAERFESEIKMNVLKAEYSDPKSGKVRVSEVYSDWIKTCNNLKPKTKASYLSLWNTMIEPEWGNRKLSSITRSEIKAWIINSKSSTGKVVSNSRMRQAYAVLKLILDHAIDMNYISRNPASVNARGSIKNLLPTEIVNTRSRILELKDLIRLAENSGEYKLLILLAGMLGLRWAEIISLTPEDFDFKKNQIVINKSLSEVNGHFNLVTPKSGKVRVLPIPNVLLNDLRALVLSTEEASPVFKSPEGTTLRHSNYMRRHFQPALSKSGLYNLTFHDLRHTAISQAIASGADVLAVSKIAGHSNPAITLKVYTHELDGSLTAVQKALDDQYTLAQSDRFVTDGDKQTA